MIDEILPQICNLEPPVSVNKTFPDTNITGVYNTRLIILNQYNNEHSKDGIDPTYVQLADTLK